MNLFNRFIVSVAMVFGPMQLSLASQLGGQIAPKSSNIETLGNIERGGTINIVDLETKSMVVDGVRYAISQPLTLYSATGKLQDKKFVLTAGMQIRFNTSKENGSYPIQIREIWITRPDGKAGR